MTKLKNLSTLAVIALIIAMVAVSCNNQTPTAAAAIGGGDEPAQDGNTDSTATSGVDFTQFIGKTFKSDTGIDESGVFYLWVEVTDTGLKYAQGNGTQKPTLDKEYHLTKNALKDNVANFTGYDANNKPQQGTATFNTDGSLVIKFDGGTSYNGKTIITLKVQ